MIKNKKKLKAYGELGLKLLNDYEAIIARDYSELGDYSRALHLLDQLIDVFRQVGGQENLETVARLEAEKKSAEDWFESLCLLVRN